jgi:hypothetical protein
LERFPQVACASKNDLVKTVQRGVSVTFIETLNIDSDELNEQFLLDFIAVGKEEGKTIDYKDSFRFTCSGACKPAWFNPSEDKLEFLKDVSSFANTSGGVILYGITEVGGSPQGITGMNIPTACTEKIKNHLNALVLAHIKPRMVVRYYPVPVHGDKSPDNKVYVLHIPKSWAGPHQVAFQDHNKFWARSDGAMHKYELDVGQLRASFLLSETLTDRIRRFREDRITNIIAGEAPARLFDDHKVILHLIPLDSFDPAKRYVLQMLANDRDNLQPFSMESGATLRYNIDGLVSNTWPNQSGVSKAYLQIFKNGIIESVDSWSFVHRVPRDSQDSARFLSINYFETGCIEALDRFLHIYKKLNVETPIYLFLTLAGVSGVKLLEIDPFYARENAPIDRDVVLVPEVCIGNYERRPHAILKDIFDSVWNACGREKSPNYNDDGSYANRQLREYTFS